MIFIPRYFIRAKAQAHSLYRVYLTKVLGNVDKKKMIRRAMVLIYIMTPIIKKQ